jgi:hypothetical protein
MLEDKITTGILYLSMLKILLSEKSQPIADAAESAEKQDLYFSSLRSQRSLRLGGKISS